MSSDFTPEQKRYLEGFSSGLQIARLGRGRDRAGQAERARRRACRGAGSRAGGRQEAVRPGEVQARRASVRRLPSPAGSGGEERVSEARRQLPLALLRPVLCRAGAELLHVPAPHPQRHRHALAVVGSRRSGGALWRRLLARHHAGELSDPRNRAEERHRSAGSDRRSGSVLEGTGADNIRNVTGTPTAGIDPQELLDTRPYARAWHHHILNQRALYGLPRKFNVAFDGAGRIAAAGRHQRHRLSGGRGEGRLRRRAGRLVPSRAWRHHRSPGFRARHRCDFEARRRKQGGGRHRSGVHRTRRPHRPQQGAFEIRARCDGLREIPGAGGGETRCKTRSRAG